MWKVFVDKARITVGVGSIEVAVKRYILAHRSHFNILEEESKILQQLSGSSDYFLEYYGQYVSEHKGKTEYGLVMEYCPTTLADIIKKRKEERRPYPPDTLTKIFRSLIEAYTTLQKKGIFHKDIKPSNILVSEQNTFKIADFNISKILNQDSERTVNTITGKLQGTRNYMAPELLEEIERADISGQRLNTARYNFAKADMFSLGLVFLELATFSPILHLNRVQYREKLDQYIQEVSDFTIQHLLRAMLNPDPRQRCDLAGALSLLSPDATIHMFPPA